MNRTKAIYDLNPTLAPGMKDGCMVTVSGQIINLFKPDPALIFLDDIAHGLANTCRWNGQTKSFYSVAEHSIKVARHLPDSKQLTAMFHDAEEAYWGDIISPLKKILPLEIITKIVEFRHVIFEKFGIPDICDEVDAADKMEMMWDWEHLMQSHKHVGMHPINAKRQWLALVQQLMNPIYNNLND